MRFNQYFLQFLKIRKKDDDQGMKRFYSYLSVESKNNHKMRRDNPEYTLIRIENYSRTFI